jgi:predicted CopG family antitoxin
MATKTVALDTEAYELLKRQKRPDESFSEAVKRLARPRRPIVDFAGMWADLTAKERRELDHAYGGLRDADRRRTEMIRQRWAVK